MKVVILHNQSILDIALQHTGSVENAFALALANDLSITDDLEAGEALNLEPSTLNQNKDILNYYTAKNIQPATAITAAVEQPHGISYWAIGIDFIVQ